MANFTGTAAADTFVGSGTAADVFTFAIANLQAADTVVGGGGNFVDRLTFSTAGTITAAQFGGVSGIEAIDLAVGNNTLTVNAALAATALSATLRIFGNSGNDTVTGAGLLAAQKLIVTANAGNDKLTGGAGDDRFDFTIANFTAADTVNGGAGSNTLQFLGSGALAAAQFANVSNVDRIVLAAGNTIGVDNGLVHRTPAAEFTIFGAAGNETIDGSAVLGTNLVMVAGAGQDTLTGGSGNDTFKIGATALNGADVISGGGAFDTIEFTAAGAVTVQQLANVSGIERLILSAAGNTVTVDEAFVQRSSDGLIVQGVQGNDVVDASAVNQSVRLLAGAGVDNLTGGSGEDSFRIAAAQLRATDTIDGGNGLGSDTLEIVANQAIGAAVFQNVKHIAQIELVAAGGGATLTLGADFQANNGTPIAIPTLHNQFAITGTAFGDRIDTSAIGAEGAGVLRMNVTFSAGGGNDSLTAGGGNDIFLFDGTAFNGSDTLVGGSGLDTLRFTGAVNLDQTNFQSLGGIEEIDLADSASTIELSAALVAGVDAGAAFRVFGGNAETAVSTVQLAADSHVLFVAGAGTGGVFSGVSKDTFEIDINTVTADDIFRAAQADDTLVLTGSGAASAQELSRVAPRVGTIVVGAHASLKGITTVSPFAPLEQGSIAIDSTLVPSGASLSILSQGSDSVDLRNLGTNRAVTVIAGDGNDLLRGGTGGETFQFTIASLNSDDTVAGGSGADKLDFTTGGTIRASDLTGVTGMDQFILSGSDDTIFVTRDLFNANRQGSSFAVAALGGDDNVQIAANNTLGAFISMGAGEDTAQGGGGSDIFAIKATDLDSQDVYQGGNGNDEVRLTGIENFDGLHDVFTGVERIEVSEIFGETTRVTMDRDDVAAFDVQNSNVLGTTFDDVLVIEGFNDDAEFIVDTSPAGPDLTSAGDANGFRFFRAGANGAVVLAVDLDLLT